MILSYGVSAALYYIDAIPFWVNYLLPYNCLTYCFSTIMTKGAGNTDSQLDKVYLEILAMLAQGVVFFIVCVMLDNTPCDYVNTSNSTCPFCPQGYEKARQVFEAWQRMKS